MGINKRKKEIFKTFTVETTDKNKICFDHYDFGHSKVIVIAPGFINSKQAVPMKDLAESLVDEYNVIIMDFRGHGKSSGLFYWTSKEYLDLQSVLQYSHQKYKKIGVIGFSLGAATGIITASKTDLMDSLISVSAPVELNKIEYHCWKLNMENDIFYNLWGEGRFGKGIKPGPWWFSKEKPVDCVGKIKTPILYIHGDADWLIKPWHSEELHKKTNSKKRLSVIKNGPHAEYLIRKNKDEMIHLIKEWFRETL